MNTKGNVKRDSDDTTKLIPPSRLHKMKDLMHSTGAYVPTLTGELDIRWKWSEYAAKHQLVRLEMSSKCKNCGDKCSSEVVLPTQTLEHYLRMS